MAVRQEINNLDSSVVVQELEFAISLGLWLCAIIKSAISVFKLPQAIGNRRTVIRGGTNSTSRNLMTLEVKSEGKLFPGTTV